MELLLWRWSTAVQITSDLIIALFFLALAHSVGRVELRAWVTGWIANLAALLVTIAFWLLQPRSPLVFAVASSLYIFAKTMFVLLLAVGAARFAAGRPGGMSYTRLAAGAAVLSLLVGFFVHSIDRLGVVGSATIGICMAAGAIFLFMAKPPAYSWLATAFLVRSVLALTEAVLFAEQVLSDDTTGPRPVATFLAAHSSFDTGAEWMIALGCVLMLYRTIQQELTQSNSDLRAAQSELQAMLDHDQLTGVFNRRSLPAMLRQAQTTGAAILFFDLDGFKKINDSLGHHFGDACLQRFARALQESFRAGDHVVRYAGDEFIVIAQGIETDGIAARIEAVRSHLRNLPAEGPPIRFSVGVAHLPAHGDADAALRAADAAMYREKDTFQATARATSIPGCSKPDERT